MERVERVHVCDLDGGALFDSAREALGDKLGGTSTDVSACLDDGPYTFVLVSLDNKVATGVILAALGKGYHVFSEKTGALTADAWQPVVDLATSNGLHVGMAYLNRFRPSVRDARRFIEMGAIGKLYGFYVQSIATAARMRDPEGSWLFDRDTAGGGYLVWLGCHYLDVLRYVTGSDVTTVAAQNGRVGYDGLKVEDASSLAMTLDSGAVGSTMFGYFLDGNRRSGSKQSLMALWGERGWIKLQPGEDDSVPLELYSTHPDFAGAPHRNLEYAHQALPNIYGAGWGLEYINTFLAACLGECAPPIDAKDIAAILHILDAAYESERTRRVVDVSR